MRRVTPIKHARDVPGGNINAQEAVCHDCRYSDIAGNIKGQPIGILARLKLSDDLLRARRAMRVQRKAR